MKISNPTNPTNPGGSNTQLQFNENGVFGGLPLTWDGSVLTLGTTYDLRLYGETVERSVFWDSSLSSFSINGTATQVGAINFGWDGVSGGEKALAIGTGSIARGTSSVVVGGTLVGSKKNSIVLGYNSYEGGTSSVCVGISQESHISSCLTLGNSASQVLIYGANFLICDSATLSGIEKVTNGTFTGSAEGWILTTGWSYSSNTIVASAGSLSILYQTAAGMVTPLVVGEIYKISLDITNFTAGAITISVGGVTFASITSVMFEDWQFTTWSQVFLATNAAKNINIEKSAATVCTIDNISIQKVTGGTTYFTGEIKSHAHINIVEDSQKIQLGVAQDLQIYHNGTDSYIDNRTGKLILNAPTTVELGSGVYLALQTSVYDDLQFAVSAGKVPAANYPNWETFTTNTAEYAFDVNEYIDCQANELPHWWKEGTAGHVHLHLTIKGNSSSKALNYMKFQVILALVDAAENAVWSEQSLSAEYTIPKNSPSLTCFYLDMGNLTLTNYLVGTQIKARIKRIAATGGTEFANSVFITQLGIHLEKNSLGSTAETTK
jgi:hypothetical protein